MQKIRELFCKRCTHKWVARMNDPKVCPKCKSPYWNVERKEVKNYKLKEVK